MKEGGRRKEIEAYGQWSGALGTIAVNNSTLSSQNRRERKAKRAITHELEAGRFPETFFILVGLFPSLARARECFKRVDVLDKEKLTEVGINGMECIAVGQVSRCSCWRTSASENKIRSRINNEREEPLCMLCARGCVFVTTTSGEPPDSSPGTIAISRRIRCVFHS